jgi:hypothetical protein
MRLKFKHIIIIGLTLAAVETWLKPSRLAQSGKDAEPEGIPLLQVRAREVSSPLAITPIPVTNWTSQVDAVMTSNHSTTNQAITLLAMFPNLPPAEQTEAANHISRLLPHDYFGALGLQLTNAATAPTARRAIFADLLTRPNGVKLPWLLEVARTDVDGQSAEALLLLQSHFQSDHGQDWIAWQNRISTWVAQNPDQPVTALSGISVSN